MTIHTLRCREPECQAVAVGSTEVEARSRMFSHLLTEHNRLVSISELKMPEVQTVEAPVTPCRARRPAGGQLVMKGVTSVGCRVED